MIEISISELQFIRDVLREIAKSGDHWTEVDESLEITEELLDD